MALHGNAKVHPIPFLPLNPTQSVSIHGWSCPKRILTWDDIAGNKGTTIHLLYSVGVGADELYALQPDIREWVQHKQVGMREVPLMLRWPLHPVDDLHCDLSDLMQARYNPAILKAVGIDYDRLVQMGMNTDCMRVLGYNLKEWTTLLGLTIDHIKNLHDPNLPAVVFQMDHETLLLTAAMHRSHLPKS